MIERRLAASTQITATVWIVGVALDLDDPSVLHVPDDAADGAAELAHARNFFDVFVLVAVWPVSFGIGTRKFADSRHVNAAFFVRQPANLLPAFQIERRSFAGR